VHTSTQKILLLTTTMIVVIILFSLTLLQFNNKIQPKPNCKIPFEVKNFISSNEIIRVCDGTFYKGSTKIVSKSEYPDLFEFRLNEDSKPNDVEQYVRVFEKDKQEYVSIRSFIDYSSWFKNSIGIYRKENNEYVLVFKKSFSDNSGRWVNIEFGEDTMNIDPYLSTNYRGEGLAISGDIGYLGCFGGCRLLWWDFYDWDSTQKTYVLANNKNQDYFKNLLVDYEDFDKTYCLKNANVSKSIASLYLLRKDKEKICSDDAVEPAATIKQAEILLKGIKAIKSIIGGENISMSEVSEVKIEF
jgi:hypothetical protein